ncbi:endonuclease/exonuclease/phosphatase family protein [Brachybacterium timonense]|uniref:endonuclease/exonuclease/phosphatase family protein n=1 Tax=Brachybacterium timonense TaxID=2050896 RepID=UPI000D0B6BFA|nr:endonuclease/exonuclease/phosphatase family protein [Brachybacterium timonense]
MTARDPRALRVLAWNLWELRGDLRAAIDAIRDLDPDVLLMQEAPRFVLPTVRLRWFASQVGMDVLVGGAGGRGLAILAGERAAAQVIRRGMHAVRQQITDMNSTYPRGVAAVRLSVPGGGAVVVSSIHFALQEPNRLAHARHLAELVRGAGCPVIAGGDLNEEATGAARTLLEPLLRDPAPQSELTFPARRPQRRIDAVLVTDGIRVHEAHAVTSTRTVAADRLREASDHLPTLVDVSVPRAH